MHCTCQVDSCQPVLWRDGKPDDPAQYFHFHQGIDAAAAVRCTHKMPWSLLSAMLLPFPLSRSPSLISLVVFLSLPLSTCVHVHACSQMTYSIIGFKGNPQAMAAPADGGGPYSWLNKTGNSWRTSNDISYSFRAVLGNMDSQENVPGIETLAGPGGWSDPE